MDLETKSEIRKKRGADRDIGRPNERSICSEFGEYVYEMVGALPG